MKKLSKIILSVAAATVVTAAMAVTAMAEDTITGTYDNDTGVVEMEGVVGSGKSQTLLVLNNNVAEGEEPGIAYINQIDNSGTFSKFTLAAGLKPATAGESVTYNIKVGGTNGTVQTGTLTIEAATPTVTTVKIVIGDVTGDKDITMQDITFIGRYLDGKGRNSGSAGQTKTKLDASTVIIGDVTGDDDITMQDITFIGRYLDGKGRNSGSTGQEVDVIDDATAE